MTYIKQVRRNVFETNSSSTHSISIADTEGILGTIPLDENNNVVLGGGEFGWEIKDYTEPIDKANYIAVYIQQWCGQGKTKDAFERLFINILKKQTGCNDVIFNFTGEYSHPTKGWAYIDHQSVENKEYHYLFENDGKELRQFIFHPESVLHTDNDNY